MFLMYSDNALESIFLMVYFVFYIFRVIHQYAHLRSSLGTCDYKDRQK